MPHLETSMRALVVNDTADRRIGLDKVARPAPTPGQARVAMRAFSLNRGEMRSLRTAPEGLVPGWDFAGVLVEGISDSMPAGTRVAGVVEGRSWAEEVAVPLDWLAPVPDAVSFEAATATATAGLTALRTLRRAGVGIGDRVLITGATGGVGQFAVQLGALGGAKVTALVNRASAASALERLGASTVLTDLDCAGTFAGIVESVGGDVLAAALGHLDERGTLVSFGNSSDLPTTFDVRGLYNGAERSILGFELFFHPVPFAADLAALFGLLESGALDPRVVGVLPWDQMPAALTRLEDRSLGGKLVLTVT